MLTQKIGSGFFMNADDSREIIVVVYLRGGMDGLNFLAPVDDPNYLAARGNGIGLREDSLKINQNLVNADFRLHNSASALHELYQNKSLAFIHAAGLTNGTRSHFEAQDLMELGSNSEKNISQGWLTRYIQTFHQGPIVSAYAFGSMPPASLLGSMDQMTIRELKDLEMDINPEFLSILSEMYTDSDSIVHLSGKNALKNIEYIKTAIRKNGGLDNYNSSAKYFTEWPGDDLAMSFKTVAQLIKMEVGLKVATIDFDGWDMHDAQGWKFPKYTEALSKNLLAFYNDINAHHNKVTVVLMTEFGRRLKANKSGGTDHGHGSVMMVMGKQVNGGNMYGKWPGLSNEELDNGVDLAVTTDYRNILSEILIKRKLVNDINQIFPKYTGFKDMGIIR